MAEYGFDTLEAAEALAAAGMAEAHAKAIAVTMRKAVTQGVATSGDVRRVEDRMATVEENMATKADVRRVEDRMATVEENMATKADLRRLEDRMTSLEDRIATVEENGATKADLMRLQDGMANLEVRVDNKLARLETRLVLTVFGAAGLLFAALKLFPAGAP